MTKTIRLILKEKEKTALKKKAFNNRTNLSQYVRDILIKDYITKQKLDKICSIIKNQNGNEP